MRDADARFRFVLMFPHESLNDPCLVICWKHKLFVECESVWYPLSVNVRFLFNSTAFSNEVKKISYHVVCFIPVGLFYIVYLEAEPHWAIFVFANFKIIFKTISFCCVRTWKLLPSTHKSVLRYFLFPQRGSSWHSNERLREARAFWIDLFISNALLIRPHLERQSCSRDIRAWPWDASCSSLLRLVTFYWNWWRNQFRSFETKNRFEIFDWHRIFCEDF